MTFVVMKSFVNSSTRGPDHLVLSFENGSRPTDSMIWDCCRRSALSWSPGDVTGFQGTLMLAGICCSGWQLIPRSCRSCCLLCTFSRSLGLSLHTSWHFPSLAHIFSAAVVTLACVLWCFGPVTRLVAYLLCCLVQCLSAKKLTLQLPTPLQSPPAFVDSPGPSSGGFSVGFCLFVLHVV